MEGRWRGRSTYAYRTLAIVSVILPVFACGSDSSISVTSPSSNSRCAVTATSDIQNASSAGSSGALTIGVNRECSWTVNADVEWVAFGAATSGQGPATIPFTVAPNAAVQPRRARVAVNDQQIEITQGAAPCRFALDHESQSAGAEGGTATVRVSAQAGCEWRAVSQESWLTLTSSSTGQGEGTIGVRIATNDRAEPREGAVEIAGLMFHVSQAAMVVPPANPPPTPTPGTPPEPGTPPTPTPPTPTPPAPPAPTPPTPTPTPPEPAPTPPEPAPPTTVALDGSVSGATGSCPTRTFTVEQRTVQTTGETKITGGNCSHIQNTAKVEVRGVVSGNVVTASSVTIVEKSDDKDDDAKTNGGGKSAVP